MKNKSWFNALDWVRGVLAITVMLSHIIGSYIGWGDVRPFVGAHLSVFYFFIMSGFVLSHANTRYKFSTHCLLRFA
jgi:peptidoglycan/LPS O-acetylase OafA/YrhL